MSATNRGSPRVPNDAYYTPAWAVDAILGELMITQDMVVLEPARGAGAIYDRLPPCRRVWAEITEGVDYLATPFEGVDAAVLNPPFALAVPFLEKVLGEAPTVVALIRLGFLAAQHRYTFWRDHPLTHLFILTKRPSFTAGGNDNADYGWACWACGARQVVRRPPGIYHLPPPARPRRRLRSEVSNGA